MKEENKNEPNINPIQEFVNLLSLLSKIIVLQSGNFLAERKNDDEEKRNSKVIYGYFYKIINKLLVNFYLHYFFRKMQIIYTNFISQKLYLLFFAK